MAFFESMLTLLLVAIIFLQFSMLEQELDWAELAALQPGRDEIVES
ncbi:hypothetical protein [Rhizobium leguminosarum]|nr:hypothetical protein [Rhizobium leguminosarum]MBY5867936.1 hypothetical protein [Rhizobium leguminosarum]